MGISQVHSTHEIFTKRKIYRGKHYKARFSDFVQGNYDREVTNQVSDICSYDDIYLDPTGNWMVYVNVIDLETGKVNKPCTIVSLPVPDCTIATVNKWERKFQKETRTHKILVPWLATTLTTT